MARVATRRALLSRPAVAVSGDWSPTDLASLVAWWDFSDGSTLYEDTGGADLVDVDGDYIKYVADKSGNGYSITRNATNITYKTNARNGLSVARHAVDGLAGADNVVISETLTFASVFKCTTSSKYHTVISTSNNADIVMYVSTDGVLTGYNNAKIANQGPYVGSTNIIDEWHIGMLVVSGTKVTGYLDGVAEFNINVSGTYENTYSLGQGIRLDYPTGNMTGDSGESVICNTTLSTPDLNALGAYLAAKWDITWTDVS